MSNFSSGQKLMFLGGIVALSMVVSLFYLDQNLSVGENIIHNTENPHNNSSFTKANNNRDDGNHQRSKSLRAESESDTRSVFEKLDQHGKFETLTSRIHSFRVDLIGAEDPAAFLRSIFQDIEKLDPFAKKIVVGTIENELASLKPDDGDKLNWLASNYSKISDVLKNNIVQGKSSEQHVFSILATNILSDGVDAILEINKIQDPKMKTLIAERVIPHLIVQSGDPYYEAVDSYPSITQTKIQQDTMETSAKDGMYRSEALGMYLRNEGEAGNQPDLPNRWFADSAWFWENSQKIADLAAKSDAGPRRDIVIAGIVKHVRKNDLDAARQWIPLVSDPNVASNLTRELTNPSNSR